MGNCTAWDQRRVDCDDLSRRSCSPAACRAVRVQCFNFPGNASSKLLRSHPTSDAQAYLIRRGSICRESRTVNGIQADKIEAQLGDTGIAEALREHIAGEFGTKHRIGPA